MAVLVSWNPIGYTWAFFLQILPSLVMYKLYRAHDIVCKHFKEETKNLMYHNILNNNV